ncbi:hypothetical protein [Pedobacter agri]|uniref:hypothetical protein n=1 Tax=Pedobacter agri TaxID=454586 RepID=UPI00292DD307|nr:hypothetical protein [Pedobacter agri]
MKLQNQLLKFFIDKTALNTKADELKNRKLAFKKLKSTEKIVPSQLQAKAEEYLEIKKLEKSVKNRNLKVMKQNSALMSILKGTGVARLKKISLEFEQYGTINFWYKEDYSIYFEQIL